MIHDTFVRGFGKLYFTSLLEDGEGTRVTHDFLGSLAEGCLRQSFYYYKETEGDGKELPFVFGEKQLHSIVVPAIADLTSAFLMEAPANRKWTDHDSDTLEEGSGWVDYWCDYRGVTFFLEFKHGYFSPRSMKLRSRLQKRWENANEQLVEVKDEIRNWISSRGARRIAISFVPYYKQVKANNSIAEDSDHLFRCHEKLQKMLNPTPNWSALCIINEDINDPPFGYENNIFEIYPAVGIYCKVFPIQHD